MDENNSIQYHHFNFDPSMLPRVNFDDKLSSNLLLNFSAQASELGAIQSFYVAKKSYDTIDALMQKIAPNLEENALSKTLAYVSMMLCENLVNDAKENNNVATKFAVVGVMKTLASIDASFDRQNIAMLVYDQKTETPCLVWGFFDDILEIFGELKNNII